MRKWIKYSVIIVLLFTVRTGVSQTTEITNLQKEKKANQKQLEQNTKQLKETTRKKQLSMTELFMRQNGISLRENQIAIIRREIRAVNKQIRKTDKLIESMEEDLQKLKDDIGAELVLPTCILNNSPRKVPTETLKYDRKSSRRDSFFRMVSRL